MQQVGAQAPSYYASSSPPAAPFNPGYSANPPNYNYYPEPSSQQNAPYAPSFAADYGSTGPTSGISYASAPGYVYSSSQDNVSVSAPYGQDVTYAPAAPAFTEPSYPAYSPAWTDYGGSYAGQVNYEYTDHRPYEKPQEQSSNDSAGIYAYDGGNSNSSDSTGIYAYDGGNSRPYGSRGTSSARWESSESAGLNPLGSLPKLAKALPKVDNESKSSGIQKFRVQLLQDSSSDGLPSSVLCLIGLDGVRILDPSNNKILRIYPLDTITKWEVNEPSVFTFWAKNSVDIEQRRTRLKSSTTTTNAILDTLTAACVQLCEMVGKDSPAAASTNSTTAASAEQKKAFFADWLLKSKPVAQEEKEHWVPDESVTKCSSCASDFGPFLRRHHCRNCGDIFCDKCTRGRIALTADENSQPVRVCDRCLAEVTHRISNAKEASATKIGTQQTHEDLAKKLQEEMERRKGSSESSGNSSDEKSPSAAATSLLTCSKCGTISLVGGSNGRCPSCGTSSSSSSAGASSVVKKSSRRHSSRTRTREVACPTCTVHLEVEVPSSGTETVECGVCQSPFLVKA